MRRSLQILCAFLIAGLASLTRAADIGPTEYELKAAFLFNFTQFVDWPTNAFQSDSDPIVIGILGPDPFGATLDKLTAGEEVRGRKLIVQRFLKPSDARRAHILFVSKSLSNKWTDILRDLRDLPILTVSDMDRFAARGGMIQLVTDRNLVRMRVNAETARNASLNISSKLLRLAENTGRDGGTSP